METNKDKYKDNIKGKIKNKCAVLSVCLHSQAILHASHCGSVSIICC